MTACAPTFFGLDLTSSEKKASAFAVLDSQPALLSYGALKNDTDILHAIQRQRPTFVAIDSPLGLPKGLCCLEKTCPCRSLHPFKGRLCERELSRLGIPSYYTTKRSIIKLMVYRAIGLRHALEEAGVHVLEVYPYASKRRLFGLPIPKKTFPEGIAFLRDKLSPIVKGPLPQKSGHDLLDAVVAAYTAYLHSRGMTEDIGDPEEWQITVPIAHSRLLKPLQFPHSLEVY